MKEKLKEDFNVSFVFKLFIVQLNQKDDIQFEQGNNVKMGDVKKQNFEKRNEINYSSKKELNLNQKGCIYFYPDVMELFEYFDICLKHGHKNYYDFH